MCKYPLAPAPELGNGLLHDTEPLLPGLTMAVQKGIKCGSAGRCGWLWEELEMGLWKRFQAGFKIKAGRRVGQGTMETRQD